MEERRKTTTTHIYNRILECEERFDRLHFDFVTSLRSGDHGRAQWLECRYLLRLMYEELFMADLEFAAKSQLLAPLWSRLYYGPVEQARSVLGRGGGDDSDKLRMEILSVIEDGIGFFMILCYRLGGLLSSYKKDMPLFIRTISKGRRVAPEDLTKGTIYDCLVYMGDLFRYRNSFYYESIMDMSLPRGQYLNATRMIPTNGHAFNQLAVLSCIEDDFLGAVSNYLRAVMAITPFPKSADNLITLCRRVVNVHEERMALSNDPVNAALLGLLLRLTCVTLVNDVTRSGQSVHLDGIVAALAKLSLRNLAFSPSDAQKLTIIFASIILAIEYLQQQNGDGSNRFLRKGQLRLVESLLIWTSKLAKRALASPTDAEDDPTIIPVSLVCLWLQGTDIIRRIKGTDIVEESFDGAFNGLARLFAECHSLDIINGGGTEKWEDSLLIGTRPISDPPCSTSRLGRLKGVIGKLAEEGVLVYDNGTKRYYLKDEQLKLLKRESFGIRLARQRLVTEVSNLQSSLPKEPSEDSPWHLPDAGTLLRCWDKIEEKLEANSIRLIITLAALRFLDVAKSDPTRMTTARQVMRCIASLSRQTPSPIHLQHPTESIEVEENATVMAMAKHHRALLAAYQYFKDPIRGYSPLILLTEDPILSSVLDEIGVDHVCHVDAYLQ